MADVSLDDYIKTNHITRNDRRGTGGGRFRGGMMRGRGGGGLRTQNGEEEFSGGLRSDGLRTARNKPFYVCVVEQLLYEYDRIVLISFGTAF